MCARVTLVVVRMSLHGAGRKEPWVGCDIVAEEHTSEGKHHAAFCTRSPSRSSALWPRGGQPSIGRTSSPTLAVPGEGTSPSQLNLNSIRAEAYLNSTQRAFLTDGR